MFLVAVDPPELATTLFSANFRAGDSGALLVVTENK
jgi:hypothetical protein